MLIKLFNNAVENTEKNKVIMIMNSDSTATLKIFHILELKMLD